MAFDQLPATMLSNIISFLEAPLATYVTVSSLWKPVIETFTFRELQIDSRERLSQLENVVTYNRRAAICKSSSQFCCLSMGSKDTD
jgi:hypothetical protein